MSGAEAGALAFDAPVQLLPWGRRVYTVVMVPDRLARAAREAGTRRVEGTIEGLPVNLGLNRADVTPSSFLYVGKGLQRRLGLEPGDVAHCRLRPADPDEVPVAGDVADALAQAGRTSAFERLRPARRRTLLAAIEAGAGAATRARRIGEMVRALPPD